MSISLSIAKIFLKNSIHSSYQYNNEQYSLATIPSNGASLPTV